MSGANRRRLRRPRTSRARPRGARPAWRRWQGSIEIVGFRLAHGRSLARGRVRGRAPVRRGRARPAGAGGSPPSAVLRRGAARHRWRWATGGGRGTACRRCRRSTRPCGPPRQAAALRQISVGGSPARPAVEPGPAGRRAQASAWPVPPCQARRPASSSGVALAHQLVGHAQHQGQPARGLGQVEHAARPRGRAG